MTLELIVLAGCREARHNAPAANAAGRERPVTVAHSPPPVLARRVPAISITVLDPLPITMLPSIVDFQGIARRNRHGCYS